MIVGGRGESGDTQPYAVEREVEDLAALVEAVGGTAYVAGQSSGAELTIEAANRLPGITKLALYEAPFMVDDTGKPITPALLTSLKEAVAQNQRSKAVKLLMKQVGIPMHACPKGGKDQQFKRILTALLVSHPRVLLAIILGSRLGKMDLKLNCMAKCSDDLSEDGCKPVWTDNASKGYGQGQRRNLV